MARNEQFLLSHSLFYPFGHGSVGSVADFTTGGRWFVMVIATGFIPLLPLSVVSTIFICGSSQWLGKNILRNTG